MDKKLFLNLRSTFDNKPALLLTLILAFFLTLSIKFVPLVYTFYKPVDFNTYKLFPLDFFDFVSWVAIFFALKFMVDFLAENLKCNCTAQKVSNGVFLSLAVFFILSWLPYFLAFYPGTVFYDEIYSMRDPFKISSQSYFYGSVLKFFWELGILVGDETFGFAIFIILRMFVMALSFSYLICFLCERGISVKFLCIASLIFAFLPIFPNNAITIQKDGLNSIFILLISIFLYKRKDSIYAIFSDKKTFLKFLALSSLIILFRSNGIHAMIFTSLVFFYLEKKARFRVFLFMVLILAIAIIPNRGRHAPFEETVGVPIQHIGRTLYNNGEITEQDKIIFNSVMDLEKWKSSYNVLTVDSTKWANGFNSFYLRKHKSEFLMAWLRTFPKNISVYLTAHAMNTYDFWAIAPWMIYGNQTIYTGAITKEQLNVENIVNDLNLYLASDRIFSKKTGEEFIRFMTDRTFYLNAGSCAFLMLFMVALTFKLGKGRRVIAVLPALFSWLTVLIASPIAIAFRYVLFFAFLMPFFLVLPFLSDCEQEN
ncbi:MAG: hypothetical protein IKN43_02695 [Selenomonadaceae bacterium]|nr:hypothetical protein [Selenomonadaceae bacterium]